MSLSFSQDVLSQLKAVLVQLKPAEFVLPLKVLNGSTLGQHTRHILEFFECLSMGIETGEVNYDGRKRNLCIETDLNFAIDLLQGLIDDFCSTISTQHPLILKVDICTETISTNFHREWAYLIEHSVHHFALIRIGIQENFDHVYIDPNFGVAYSTQLHLSKQAVTV